MTTNDQTRLHLAAHDAKEAHGQTKVRKPSPFTLLFLLLPLMLITLSLLMLSDQFADLTVGISLHGLILFHRGMPTLSPTSSPTPQPTQQSVKFLPAALAAQIADLEAHDRFFYHGNTGLPEVALTFDDGPNPANTPQLLAILKNYHVQATFFDVGRLVKLYPYLARQEIADGHIIGNHTWSHAYLPALTPDMMRKQIAKTSDIIQQVTGIRPIFFRPPYGAVSAKVLTIINEFGLTTVIWNNDAQDWSIPGTFTIIARVLAAAGPGAIILLHDGGGNRSQTIAALPTIIQQLRAQHFQFVTMAQLVADYHYKAASPTPTPTPTRPPRGHPHSPQSAPFAWQKEKRSGSQGLVQRTHIQYDSVPVAARTLGILSQVRWAVFSFTVTP